MSSISGTGMSGGSQLVQQLQSQGSAKSAEESQESAQEKASEKATGKEGAAPQSLQLLQDRGQGGTIDQIV